MHNVGTSLFLWFCVSGVYNYQVEEDISKLKMCVNSLLQEYSLNVNVKDDYIHELWVLITGHECESMVRGNVVVFPKASAELSKPSKFELSPADCINDLCGILCWWCVFVLQLSMRRCRAAHCCSISGRWDLILLSLCLFTRAEVKFFIVYSSTIFDVLVSTLSSLLCTGAAAQEAIKLITHQFVPFNNTFIYNAMVQTSATFQLWTSLMLLWSVNDLHNPQCC